MYTPTPTLRSLIRTEQLIPLEPRSAFVLQVGYRVLYIAESVDLDAKLEETRAAVQVVTVGVSGVTGGLAVQPPGTLNTLGLETLPRSDRGTVRFYYMPAGGSIPEWTLTDRVEVQRETPGARRSDFAAESGGSYGDPRLEALSRQCGTLPLHVLQLIYRGFTQPNVEIEQDRANLYVTASGKCWKDLYDLLVTQLKIHSVFGVDETVSQCTLDNHGALQDLYRLVCLILEVKKARNYPKLASRRMSATLTSNPQQRYSRLTLFPQ